MSNQQSLDTVLKWYQYDMAFKGLKSTSDWYIGFNSLGGLTQWRDSDNWASKAFWGTLFCVGVTFTLLGVWATVAKFLAHDTVIAIEADFSWQLPFPAITVCNSNVIHCSHFYDLISECEAGGPCDRIDLYCELFLMTQCSVALYANDLFKWEEPRRQNVCIEYAKAIWHGKLVPGSTGDEVALNRACLDLKAACFYS